MCNICGIFGFFFFLLFSKTKASKHFNVLNQLQRLVIKLLVHLEIVESEVSNTQRENALVFQKLKLKQAGHLYQLCYVQKLAQWEP